MNRPVTVTSPTHGIALGAYVGQGALAVQLLQGVATTKALDASIGRGAEWAVPALMLITSIGALVAAWALPQAAAQDAALRLEAWSVGALGLLTIAYAWSLTHTYGWSGGATTQTYAWSLGVGMLMRVWQIVRDRRRIRAATQAGVPATPAPLGEPDDTRG